MIRRLVPLIALALVVVACTATTGDGSTTSSMGSSNTSEGATATTAGAGAVTTTAEAAPTWTDLPGVDDLPQEVQDELLALVRTTEEIRGLLFVEPPIITIVSEAELEARVRSLIEEETEDFPADDALYKLLGLLDPESDLEALLVDLYGEQVAGFYDGETGELVVPAREEGFSVVQRSTMVHELTHSLTDQHFDFDPVMEQLFEEDRLDEVSAFQALVEGDASLTELLYLQTLSQQELGEFFAEALQVDSSALEASPPFIQDSLIFPYDSGLAFVQQLYTRGDWAAVNDAYLTLPDLPGSTEQVISPSDYKRDLPIDVSAVPVSVPNYNLERVSVWGELGFRIMFDQILGEGEELAAVDGWGGDTYYQWFDGENAAMVIFYEGDTERDRLELKDALVDYALTAVAEEDFVWVEVIDDQLVFIVADEPEVGDAILADIKG